MTKPKNMTPEQWNAKRREHYKAVGLTADQKAKRSEAARERWAHRTAEEKVSIAQAKRDRKAAMSNEQREREREVRAAQRAANWELELKQQQERRASLTPEQTERIREGARVWRRNLSPERRELILQRKREAWSAASPRQLELARLSHVRARRAAGKAERRAPTPESTARAVARGRATQALWRAGIPAAKAPQELKTALAARALLIATINRLKKGKA